MELLDGPAQLRRRHGYCGVPHAGSRFRSGTESLHLQSRIGDLCIRCPGQRTQATHTRMTCWAQLAATAQTDTSLKLGTRRVASRRVAVARSCQLPGPALHSDLPLRLPGGSEGRGSDHPIIRSTLQPLVSKALSQYVILNLVTAVICDNSMKIVSVRPAEV